MGKQQTESYHEKLFGKSLIEETSSDELSVEVTIEK